MRMTGRWKWLALIGIGMFLALTALPAAPVAAQVEAAAVPGRFYGTAYGTYATANTGELATTFGRSARVSTGCSGAGGIRRSNTAYSVVEEELASINKLYTTLSTDRTDTRATVRATARANGVNLLDGLITADSILAVSTTTATPMQFITSDNGSRFVNLVIDGNSIPSDVERNTTIELPGLGYVRLHSVNRETDGNNRVTFAVAMLQVFITQANEFDPPTGARIVIARAWSGYNREAIEAIMGGEASATNAKISDPEIENRFGKSALVWVTCDGTDGETLTNSINATDAGGALGTGTGATTAFGGPTTAGNGHYARTTATVEGISAFGGLITADAVKAVSRSQVVGGVASNSTVGSRFVNLKVGGIEIGDNVAPNSERTLAGIGKVILYEVRASASAQNGARQWVTMIRIVITEELNVFDLPVGSDIRIANASSEVRAVD